MHAEPDETAIFLIAIINDSPSTNANDIFKLPLYLYSNEPLIYIYGIFYYIPFINLLYNFSTCFISYGNSYYAISAALPKPTHKCGANVPLLKPLS